MSTVKKTKSRRTQVDRSDESRARILKAAERVFARDGLAGARMDVIAAEARANKALLYYYFKSKDRLYESIIEEHLGEFNRRVLGLLRGPGPAPELLLEYVDLQFDYIGLRQRHAPLFQEFMSKSSKAAQRLVREYIVPRAEALRALLVRGMREGDLRKADPFHTSVTLASLIVFYFSSAPMLRMIGHPDPYTPASLARRKKEVRDFVRYGLFTNAEGVKK